MKPGTAKDSFLTPGEVDPRHFELLLEGTSIRAQPLIDALREHLVNGVRRNGSAPGRYRPRR
ncbi:TPA: PapB/FocB family fimbrial expression transcriptional regulator [Pseudomonas aeruginosa]